MIPGEVVGEIGLNQAKVFQESLVGGQRMKALDRHISQKPDRVAARALPQLRINRSKQILGFSVPAPPEIAGQVAKWLERLGQHRANDETANSAHWHNLQTNVGCHGVSALDCSARFSSLRLLLATLAPMCAGSRHLHRIRRNDYLGELALFSTHFVGSSCRRAARTSRGAIALHSRLLRRHPGPLTPAQHGPRDPSSWVLLPYPNECG